MALTDILEQGQSVHMTSTDGVIFSLEIHNFLGRVHYHEDMLLGIEDG